MAKPFSLPFGIYVILVFHGAAVAAALCASADVWCVEGPAVVALLYFLCVGEQGREVSLSEKLEPAFERLIK